MEAWALTMITIFLSLAAALLLMWKAKKLPPGPLAFPLIGNLVFLKSDPTDFPHIMNRLWAEHGPIITIQLGVLRMIMIGNLDLSHEVLVRHGASSADRPSSFILRTLTGGHDTISTTRYGSLWRLLRRNLAADLYSPHRNRQIDTARKWAQQFLLQELRDSPDGIVRVRETFQHAIFGLLAFLCFGERIEEAIVREIQAARTELLSQYIDVSVFDAIPKLAKKWLFQGRRKHLEKVLQRQVNVFLPLIKSRREMREGEENICYVDSLLDLRVTEEGDRRLLDEEMIFLCAEFFDGGSETTSTTLEWIMANLVKHPEIQERLFKEEEEEEDLHKRKYLKAVVMEGLRRHPPSKFLIMHSATEEMAVGKYFIPKGVTLNFDIARSNLDGATWKEPTEFRPERFLTGGEGEGMDLTGKKKLPILTFGAGRRICPGMNWAVQSLEFFIASIVGEFKWEAVDEVDMSEQLIFTTVMKKPLRARISPRK